MTDGEPQESISSRTDALELIPLLARAVAAASELTERHKVIHSFLDRVVTGGIPAAAVHLLDERSNTLVLSAARNLPPLAAERLRQLPFQKEDCRITEVARSLQERLVTGVDEPLLRDVPGPPVTLCAPLVAQGRLEGVLSLWLNDPDAVPPHALHLVRTAADALAALIGSCDARERAARDVQRIESVDAAALEIAGPLDVHSVLQRIVDHARSLAGGSYATLGILADGDARGPFSAIVESGTAPARVQAPHELWPQSVVTRLSHGAGAVRFSELTSDEQRSAPGIRSLVAVAVRYAEQTLGYLFVANRKGGQPFDAADQRALELLAQHAAIAVAHAREHEQLVRAIDERARSEQALAESERRFRRLAENVPDVIFRLELKPRAHFGYVSRAIRNVLGHLPEAYLKDVTLPLRQIHPLDRRRLEGALKNPEESGQGLLLRWIHAEGRPVWIETRFAAVRNDDGDLIAVEGVARDVTGAKRAEAEIQSLLDRMRGRRAWLETVIDHSPVGIVLVEDPQGLRIRANREAQHLFGRPLEPTGGIDQFIHQVREPSGTRLPYQELITVRALQGEQVHMEQLLCDRPDGRAVPVLVSGTPITDARGNVEGAVLIYRDISALKELERLREEWTSVIAHDLRQPVNVISMEAHLLVRNARERKLRQRAEHILGHSRKLTRMIDDLLEFSRIESRNLEVRRQLFALEPLVGEIVRRFELTAGGRKVRFSARGGPLRLYADPDRLEQVLTNLISNALKYGRAGSDVQVLAEPATEGVHLSVTNEGEGIPPAELPELFRKFHRTRSARLGKVSGLGLGLYITRGLVEAHGGRIWADSHPGERTTFHVVLPAAADLPR